MTGALPLRFAARKDAMESGNPIPGLPAAFAAALRPLYQTHAAFAAILRRDINR